MPLVTLTTDFGHGSPYVAQLKGVLLSLCPDARLIDITHGIAPQNIPEGAVVLSDTTPFFPSGTLHIAVVDPGVGSSRRLLYAEFGEQKYLLPDNGLLTLVARAHPTRKLIVLESRRYWRGEVSSTFHGRDILAPVAAHLCRGVLPEDLGPATKDFVRLPWPDPAVSGRRIAGHVVYVDSLGNLITNITREHFAALGPPADAEVSILGHTICGIGATYSTASPGNLIALSDSQGRLEIAVVNGSAASELAACAGVAVDVVGAGP